MIDYDSHKWHRHLFDVRGTMVREIMHRVAFTTAWAVLVVLLEEYFLRRTIPVTVHSLVGTALGLLLVFRTNASYDRFWEGRKLWGGIVNETRNLARMSSVLLARQDPEKHAELVRWTIAWAYCTMHSLRGRRDLGPIAEQLPQGSVKRALQAQHAPLWLAIRMSRVIEDARREGLIDTIQQQAMDHNVQLLIDYVGACERIVKTPLPFAYVVHLRRALLLYTFTLPFALLRDMGNATIAAVFFVSYVFYGIEEIGVQIEDPFGYDDNDLPLERICSTIENNLKSTIDGEVFQCAPIPTEGDELPQSAV
ncbi:MAG: bestrophin family ion channel [Deltaproteobacteria bacterium]|nr:bestrophin family ion channel [Deltaproteobacteria bacterium]